MHRKLAVFLVLMMALVLVSSALAGTKYHVLYNFQGNKDGLTPQGALIPDAAGNLYGVTVGGGYGGDGFDEGCGTVFEMKRLKSGWTHEVLYRFPSSAK